MKDPDLEESSVRLGDPFAFSLHNIIWLGGTAAVVLTLLVLKMTGVLH